MKLTIEIDIHQENKDFDGKIVFKTFFRLLRYSMKIPALDLDEESPSVVYRETNEGLGVEETEEKKFSVFDFIRDIELFQDFLKQIIGFYLILEYFLSKVEISSIEWQTHLGLDDAAKTGSGCGLVWGMKGSFVGLLAHYMRMTKRPEIEVIPHFQGMTLATNFRCMVSFRIGYAIHTGLKILRHKKSSSA